MTRSFLTLLFIFAIPGYAKEISAKKAFQVDGYLFIEPSRFTNALTIASKTETIVTSKIKNTTTTGTPIWSWVINTRWIDDINASNIALNKAIIENPEWETYAKRKEDISSRYCKFLIEDPDIKVSQGDRNYSLSSTSNLCTYLVHTKGSADEKLQLAIDNNRAIDSGLDILNVYINQGPKQLFEAQSVSQRFRSLVKNENALFSEKEAAFFLGATLVKLGSEHNTESKPGIFDLYNQRELTSALNETFEKLFETSEATPNIYKLKLINSPSPIFVETTKHLAFDPQSRN